MNINKISNNSPLARGVAGGTRRGVAKKFIIAIMCVFGIATAYAENENAATSKEYVDTEIATKQPTISAAGNNVVMTFDSTATDGIGTKNIYDPSGSYAAQQDALVTASTANTAVQMAINGELVCTGYSDIDPNDCWFWSIVTQSPNKFPAPANQTQTQNGVTVTVRDGIYSFSGIANADIYFEFELPKTYTPIASVGKAGRGVMYLWNNKELHYDPDKPAVRVYWYDPSHSTIDYWALNRYGINRTSSTYSTQTGYTIKYVRITIPNGVNMNDFSFAPMFVEDGVTTYTHFYPYNPDTFLPTGN